ncbi:MAG TPA: hypothetical protein VK024_08640 [Actinomycetaceae bacterium]|nr:hypothetical protein [Actinomycetaceae bacterium]
MSAVAEYVMPEDEARRLTEKIRLTAHTYAEAREKLIGYVEEAKAGNAHLALGYRSWTEYLSEVLGEEPMRLARDERREVVQLLSSEGMSTRAIAPIVGASHDTVHRDLHAAPVRNLTPAPEPPTTPEGGTRSASTPSVDIANVDKETGEILADGSPEIVKLTGPNSVTSPGRTITGMDGKTYTRPEPRQPSAPKRRPLTDQFFDAFYDLTKVTERIDRLTEDDRFPQNAEKVAAKHRSDLLRAKDLLEQVINRLPQA